MLQYQSIAMRDLSCASEQIHVAGTSEDFQWKELQECEEEEEEEEEDGEGDESELDINVDDNGRICSTEGHATHWEGLFGVISHHSMACLKPTKKQQSHGKPVARLHNPSTPLRRLESKLRKPADRLGWSCEWSESLGGLGGRYGKVHVNHVSLLVIYFAKEVGDVWWVSGSFASATCSSRHVYCHIECLGDLLLRLTQTHAGQRQDAHLLRSRCSR